MAVSRLLRVRLLLAATMLATRSGAERSGTMEGEVLDALTPRPVADAVVIAQGSSMPQEQMAVTDGTGHFAIALLPAGTYTLIVQREGYQPFTGEGPVS